MDRQVKYCCVESDDVEKRIPFILKMREKGFAMSAIGTCDSDCFKKHNIPYEKYHLTRDFNPWADHQTRWELEGLISRFAPDIVHAFNTKPGLYATLAARNTGVPIRIRTITGRGRIYATASPLSYMLRYGYRTLQRKASLAASMTIFQNHDDRDFFLKNRLVTEDHQAVVASSGVDIEEIEKRAASSEEQNRLRQELGIGDELVITMVSRLIRQKGVLEYLRAAKEMQAENPSVKFLLVGPRKREGSQAVSEHVLEKYRDYVCFLGPRDDVPRILSISDVLALPTYYCEGVPRVLLEAGALGLPVVTTGIAGCREVVKHELNGLVIPPRDVPALVSAIKRLVGSKHLRDDLGAAGRRVVRQQFTIEHVASAYHDILKGLFPKKIVDHTELRAA